jgi:uncharacterized membrane protein YqiK
METTLLMLGVAAAAALALFLASVFAIRNFYVVPRADEALVKTGGKEPVVSTGGGLWVIPMFHRVTRVSLKAVKIPIERTGENALPTANKIPAEIRGELIVRVSPDDPKHVVLAAQSLGTEGGSSGGRMEEIIQQQVDSLVTDALRTAAFKKSFEKLNSEKAEFADEVTQLLASDLAKLGLVLVAVTVPHLKQGEFTRDPGDVFAAEGQRNVAETVAKNRQETNKIKREADIKVQEQDVEARERALTLDRKQKELEAEQARQVAEFTATKETETTKAVLAQEQARALAAAEQKKSVETSRITQDQEIQAAQIVQEQTLSVQRAKAGAAAKQAEEEGTRIRAEAEIARQKAVESAGIEKDKAIKVADQQRTQAISEAEIAREVAIAGRKADEADARGKQATAEAQQRKAEETIVTVKAEAEADRARRVVVIKADEQAQQQKVAADRDAYVQTRKAEGDRDASIKQAEAVRAQAEGRAEAAKAEAAGRAEAAKVDAEGQANAVKATAAGRAEALKYEAEAEASARTTRANAEFDASDKEAKAKIALAGAILEEGRARAESERLLTEARNAVSNQMMMTQVAMRALDQGPAMIREFMAPITKVSDVRVLQVNGLGGSGGEAGANLPATIMGAGLAAAGALPMIKEAMRGFTENPEVQEIAGILGGVAKSTLREATAAVRDAGAASTTHDVSRAPVNGG